MSQDRKIAIYRGGNKANDDRERGTASFQASDDILARAAMGDRRTGNALRYTKGPLKGQKKFKEVDDKVLRSQKARGVSWSTKHEGKKVRVYGEFRITLSSGETVKRRKQRTFTLSKYRDFAGVNNDMARQLIAEESGSQGNSDFSIETLNIDAIVTQTKRKKTTGKTKGKRRAAKKVTQKKAAKAKKAKATRKTRSNTSPKRIKSANKASGKRGAKRVAKRSRKR